MKYTLLQLTQAVLSSMDGDEINSITDTVESQQVATAIRTVYFDIVSRSGMPELDSFVNLDASGDAAKPTLMTLPSDVLELYSLKYDKHTTLDTSLLMLPVVYKPLEDFMQDSYALDPDDTTVDSMSISSTDTVTVLYRNDKAPDFYTTYDDNTLLFDSYDSDVDTTLQASKTLAFVRTSPTFTLDDGFTPDLDEPQFALLMNEAKALCWAEYRQIQHGKAEVNAKRGWTRIQKTKFATETAAPLDRLPNYGRK